MKKYWWLGFLGFIGFYKLPVIIDFFQGTGNWFVLINLLWFFWFLEFIPQKNKPEEDTPKDR
ncbi:hypothetical protein [Pseudoalteromonas aliena]|jgi:hypothetical protein|uniref:Uncharacterized protein n=1 Tax=Pseudoalteromonas aliena SW19 TaxID=1314866 RepID=A0ABR9E1V3_9GAMM|nr:hypothetical protein [Pseudoalteromonas aliena]MBE0359846.1 hypothetical protein [Pseudoalteromonas aliena SW19]